MTTNAIFDQHAAELSEAVGLKAEVQQDGNRLFVVLKDYGIPKGMSKATTTDMLFVADTQYPFSATDMFWTDLNVVRPDGSSFENSDSIEQYLGQGRRNDD